jgi:hypothetical protein
MKVHQEFTVLPSVIFRNQSANIAGYEERPVTLRLIIDDVSNAVPNGVLAEPVIKRILRGLFCKQPLTYFEIESTDDGNFVLRTLTPEAQEWCAKFLAEPRPNGDRIVSSAIVAAVAADAMKRGYLVQFV